MSENKESKDCVVLAERVKELEAILFAKKMLIKTMVTERDEALTKWHAHQKNVPCSGCKNGHDTFWKSVIESPQWVEWARTTRDFDTAECEGCGHISGRHFQAFLEFCSSSLVSNLVKVETQNNALRERADKAEARIRELTETWSLASSDETVIENKRLESRLARAEEIIKAKDEALKLAKHGFAITHHLYSPGESDAVEKALALRLDGAEEK